MLRKLAVSVLNRVAPHITNRRYLDRHTAAEPEIALLPALVPPGKLAIDVGANRGLYVHHLRALKAKVIAFEPLPPMQQWLKRNYPDLDLRAVALSDEQGTAAIRYPKGIFSWATLAASNDLALAGAEIEELEVPLRTLDSYAFQNVGFIKIDVEGYEEAVLRGAERLLAQGPRVLIEVEDRHNPGAPLRVRDFMAERGYAGFFLDDGELVSAREFAPATHAPLDHVGVGGKSGRYINNFVYVPESDAGELADKMKSLA
jgi:FkbM family methyltransferase